MRFHERIRIQTFCLILAALLFGGREVIHPLFHIHDCKTCGHSHFTGTTGEPYWGKAEAGEHGDSHEHICPFCNDPTGKYADTAITIAMVADGDFPVPLYIYENVFSIPYREALSRGPPAS
jgi:hypothetical protein